MTEQTKIFSSLVLGVICLTLYIFFYDYIPEFVKGSHYHKQQEIYRLRKEIEYLKREKE